VASFRGPQSRVGWKLFVFVAGTVIQLQLGSSMALQSQSLSRLLHSHYTLCDIRKFEWNITPQICEGSAPQYNHDTGEYVPVGSRFDPRGCKPRSGSVRYPCRALGLGSPYDIAFPLLVFSISLPSSQLFRQFVSLVNISSDLYIWFVYALDPPTRVWTTLSAALYSDFSPLLSIFTFLFYDPNHYHCPTKIALEDEC